MADEIDVENGRNSNFEGLVTLTLTFDPAIPHTVVHHSSTSTYILNFIQIEETFCGRTDVRTYGRTDGRTDIFPLYIIRSTLGSRPNKFVGPAGGACSAPQAPSWWAGGSLPPPQNPTPPRLSKRRRLVHFCFPSASYEAKNFYPSLDPTLEYPLRYRHRKMTRHVRDIVLPPCKILH